MSVSIRCHGHTIFENEEVIWFRRLLFIVRCNIQDIFCNFCKDFEEDFPSTIDVTLHGYVTHTGRLDGIAQLKSLKSENRFLKNFPKLYNSQCPKWDIITWEQELHITNGGRPIYSRRKIRRVNYSNISFFVFVVWVIFSYQY